MRIRWRGLELPSRITLDEEVSTDTFGRFVIEPFEQGFGTTIGNSLRRVLLSSLEGAAVTDLKIEGVSHEFSSIDGVLEDVTDIILNIKGVVLKLEGADYKKMTLERTTAGVITAGDFVTDPAVTIINPEHVIATLTADIPFKAELSVATGRGYVTSSENRTEEQELGVIPLDSIYSPVRRVRFRTEDMRVGQKTNYDRLILEIWTSGTLRPEEALVEASLILRKHLNPFVMYQDMGVEYVSTPDASAPPSSWNADAGPSDLMDKPITALNLSVRANNCIEAAKISTVGELVSRTEADLLRFRSFGKTSLYEVQRKLEELGLSLGMASSTSPSPATPLEETPPPAMIGGDMMIQHESPLDSPPPPPASIETTGPMEAFTMGD